MLDSFLGSGTTAAVAHKMGRRYIGIEMGEHAVTHCAPRLKKVIDGEQGGISEAVDWKGGGGFRFYRLGPQCSTRKATSAATFAFQCWPRTSGSARPARLERQGRAARCSASMRERAYALLYNGILGDKRPDGGNVLTRSVLAVLRRKLKKADAGFQGTLVVYGEQSRLGASTLEREADHLQADALRRESRGAEGHRCSSSPTRPTHSTRCGASSKRRASPARRTPMRRSPARKPAGRAATARHYRPLAGSPQTPYVCLRLPTGGGKTMLAAHAIGVARDAWIEQGLPVGSLAGAVEHHPPANRRGAEEHAPPLSSGARRVVRRPCARVRYRRLHADPAARHPRQLLRRRRHDPDLAGVEHRRPQGLRAPREPEAHFTGLPILPPERSNGPTTARSSSPSPTCCIFIAR